MKRPVAHERRGVFRNVRRLQDGFFAALATRNFTTVLAGILMASPVAGLRAMRAGRFTFTSLPKPGRTNSPTVLTACRPRW